METEEAFWVIGAPTDKTYKDVPIAEILSRFTNQSYKEFDKQFKKKPETEKIKDSYGFIHHCRATTKLNKKIISLEIEKWGDKSVNAFIDAFIYTYNNGFPKGEATHIRKVDGDVDIRNDLKNFYQRFNWGVESPKDLDGIDPQEVGEWELDKYLLPEISIINYRGL